MERRFFVKQLLVSSTALSTNPLIPAAKASASNSFDPTSPFSLNFAPPLGMFTSYAGEKLADQLTFLSINGFKTVEDSIFGQRSGPEQRIIIHSLQKLGMELGTFTGHSLFWRRPTLSKGDSSFRNTFMEEIKKSIELAKVANSKWITVFPGYIDLTRSFYHQKQNVIDTLQQASELLEPLGMVMLIKPVSYRLHKGQLVQNLKQASQICQAVNSPACKILHSIYNQQITKGNIISSLETYWEEIGYIQVADNPGRNEPNTGEINYSHIFSYIRNKGYQGIIGLDHGNSLPGRVGEEAVIRTYREMDFGLSDSI